MADITLNYNYAIPDEQFIDDFTGNATGSFTYNGPDVLVVTVPEDGSAYTQSLTGPVYDGETTVNIDLNTNPELAAHAALLYGRPEDFVPTFEEVTLPDGHVYQNQTNKDIHDYYMPPTYNMETSSWNDPELIVADVMTAKMRTFIEKADVFLKMGDFFELDTETQTAFDTFQTAIDTYRSRVATPWKYDGDNPADLEAPKIPMGLVNLVSAARGLLDEEDIKKITG